MMPERTIAPALATIAIIALLSSPAAAGKGANCVSKSGVVSNQGTDGSTCEAQSDGSGRSIANSKKNSQSFADQENGGSSRADANRESFADAESSATCSSKATAQRDGEAESFCTKDGGIAKSTATKGSDQQHIASAIAEADEDCNANAKAAGPDSVADAVCSTPGGFARATASGGGLAEASDVDPPDCDVSGGGHAKVVSSAGNCEK